MNSPLVSSWINLITLIVLINSVSGKLLPYNSIKYPPANLTSSVNPGFARIGQHVPHLHSQLLTSSLPMTLHPSPISTQLPLSGSLSPDLYWIPTLGQSGHRERGFFGKIRSFFTEMRVDPSRAFIHSFDLFLGRLGEAIFHALVEIGLDFILGFGRG